MSFVTLEFVVFFAVVLTGLAVMPTRGSRQGFLLVMSFLFYASGTPWFVLVLLVPALVDYACAIRMQEAPSARRRRDWLVLSLVVNLGILVYFKYADFFVESIASVFGLTTAPLAVVLPVGISFFTFKTMSYTIDVYRGNLRASRSLGQYALFVSFFPELVAGPIVRASVFLPQLGRSLALSWARTGDGLQLVLLGLTKKLLVADRLATFVDPVFLQPELFSGGTVLTAVVAYSIQIYCDFSGYSDIAIGIARIIGFDLPENFNLPYIATSITDFWRRWHITLSQWLRDYLYIPLGGNRRGPVRTYVNLLITMLLGGLWHGASWNFVLWGLLHGLGLVAHRLWSARRFTWAPLPPSVAAFVGWAVTYVFVCIGWILFRSPDLAGAVVVLQKILGLRPGGISWFYLPFWLLLGVTVAAHLVQLTRQTSPVDTVGSHAEDLPAGSEWRPARALIGIPRGTLARTAFLTMWIVVLFLFMPIHRSPFIYFQF